MGIHVGSKPIRVETWSQVLFTLRNKISTWKSVYLSIWGRVTLLNSIMHNLPIYLLSFVKIPMNVRTEIIKIQRNFLWHGEVEKRGISWVRWEDVCKEKYDWGMRVKGIGSFNKTLLCKWIWRFIKRRKQYGWES